MEYNELLEILGLFSDVRPTDGTDVLVILQPDGSCTVTDGDKLRIDCAPNSNEGVLSMLTGMAPSHITLLISATVHVISFAGQYAFCSELMLKRIDACASKTDT